MINTPPPPPGCTLYGDPMRCAGISLPEDSTTDLGSSFSSICLGKGAKAQLESQLLRHAGIALGAVIGAAAVRPLSTQGGALNVTIAIPPGGIPVSPEVLANSYPVNDPIFEPCWHNEIRTNASVPGLGSSIHILFNLGGTLDNPVIITAKVHADIGNARNGISGKVVHGLGDVVFGTAIGAIPGCTVKFD